MKLPLHIFTVPNLKQNQSLDLCTMIDFKIGHKAFIITFWQNQTLVYRHQAPIVPIHCTKSEKNVKASMNYDKKVLRSDEKCPYRAYFRKDTKISSSCHSTSRLITIKFVENWSRHSLRNHSRQMHTCTEGISTGWLGAEIQATV